MLFIVLYQQVFHVAHYLISWNVSLARCASRLSQHNQQYNNTVFIVFIVTKQSEAA